MRTTMLVLLATLGLPGWGAPPQSYFYAVAQTDGDPAWAWAVPECQPLSAAELQRMRAAKQCVKHGRTAHKCTPEQQVELENVNTGKKQKFALSQFVFPSLKACRRDRQAYFDSLGE